MLTDFEIYLIVCVVVVGVLALAVRRAVKKRKYPVTITNLHGSDLLDKQDAGRMQ